VADLLIAEFPKNSRDLVRVAIREFRGCRNIDLRVYAENGRQEVVPTAKGISLKPALLRPVIAALREAERIAVIEGLLTDEVTS